MRMNFKCYLFMIKLRFLEISVFIPQGQYDQLSWDPPAVVKTQFTAVAFYDEQRRVLVGSENVEIWPATVSFVIFQWFFKGLSVPWYDWKQYPRQIPMPRRKSDCRHKSSLPWFYYVASLGIKIVIGEGGSTLSGGEKQSIYRPRYS